MRSLALRAKEMTEISGPCINERKACGYLAVQLEAESNRGKFLLTSRSPIITGPNRPGELRVQELKTLIKS